MLQFINYNLIEDGNSLDPCTVELSEITSVQLQNAIYNDFYISSDVISGFSTVPPTDWEVATLLWATFDNSINAGSVEYTADEIDAVRIKKRRVGTYDWITIYEQPINSASDLLFSGTDYFSANETEYEYAWVPVVGSTEGNYSIQTIESKFKGVFIADADTIYKMLAGVAYGGSQQIQLVATYNPIGRKYPIYVSNGETNYETGSVTGKLIGNYENTGVFNRKEMVQQKNAFIKFLINKKAKVLKDQNSNIWLIFIIGEPSITYDAQWGNGMMEVSYQWGELGDIEDASAMQNVGLLPIVQ